MKHIILKLKLVLVIALLALPVLAFGQIQVGTDTTFIYAYNQDYTGNPALNLRSPDVIDSIVFYSLKTDLFIRKSVNADRSIVESIVKTYLPDAQFKWNSSTSWTALNCRITTECVDLDDALTELRSKDEITSVSYAYIRKDYKDLLDMYPFVDEVTIYGFTDYIEITYLSEATKQNAIDLIESMGLIFEKPDEHISPWENVTIPKSKDLLTVISQLNESGYFQLVTPILCRDIKELEVQQIYHSNIPFYYNKQTWENEYLYPTPNGFAIRKSPETDKGQLESIIKTYAVNNCKIIWVNADYCMVKTDEKYANTARTAMMNLNEVLWVSELYLDEVHYSRCLSSGWQARPTNWGLDGRLFVSFKEGLSETVKNDIIDEYNLSFVAIDSIKNYIFTDNGGYYITYNYYSIFELPKMTDVLSVCRNIYESGNAQYVIPNIIKEKDESIAILVNGTTTSVKKGTGEVIEQTGIQYYNLLGQRIDTPSGFTIVVTRYSDGTVRTEKKLF